MFALPMSAQQSGVSPAFAYGSPLSAVPVISQTAPQRRVEALRDVLEMMAENLDLSHQQKDQLETLLGRQHELLAALHQHTDLSDQQKSAQFQEIRRQTRQQFAAMLTPQQRREFESMMR